MDTDMKAHVISLLETYSKRERQIDLLHYEMQHGARVSPEEMINYQERMDRMNAESMNEIAERLLELEAEQARMKEQAEAEQQKAAEQEDIVARLGHSLESETLFDVAFMEWLRLYKSPPTRKPSTYASYIATYDTHFAPAFGAMPLFEITQDVVQDYYQRKQLKGGRQDGKEGGLSPKTIRNHHMILKDFFTYAETKYKLFGNPTLSTTRPEVVQMEMRVLRPDEMRIFMEEVMKETQRIAILTDLFTGLRVGELLALEIGAFLD